MTTRISLHLQELRVETDLAGPDLGEATGDALEAALTELARRLQVLLAGRSALPEVLVLPDIVVREDTAGSVLAGSGVDLILAQVEAGLRGQDD